MAQMMRDDLAEARKQWLSEVKDNPQEYAQREQSDFFTDTNHEGEVLDFHSLRHTCGAWLAMTGVHVKTVQTVMRHQSITLTMDAYGHLFPGQEADAIGRLQKMLVNPEAETLRATGTDNHAADSPEVAQRQAQRTGRETWRSAAKGKVKATYKGSRLSLCKLRTLAMSCDATSSVSSGGGTQTPDTRTSSHFPSSAIPRSLPAPPSAPGLMFCTSSNPPVKSRPDKRTSA